MLEILKNRKSIRSFKEEIIKEEDLSKILEIGLRAPTYANTQVISLIVVKDKKRKEELALLSGNQSHIKKASAIIVVVIDFYRTKKLFEELNQELKVVNNIESLIIGSVDAGLVLLQIQTAAHTLGYGTTAIGGIRENADKVIELLNLPKYTYPLVATTIGVPEDNLSKVQLPRLDYSGTIFYEEYDNEKSFESEKNYEEKYRSYCQEINRPNLPTFVSVVSKYFSFEKLITKTSEFLKNQGFSFK